MDRYYSQTIGSVILTTAGVPVGRVIEIAIEPETGKITGFLLAPRGQNVVAPSDVLFWNESLFIHDEDNVIETEDIIKLREVLEKNIPILHNKVYTKKGLYLGKVYDIGMSSKFFVMTKLAVAKDIFGLFPYDEKLIAHGNILEIKKDRIIVKDVAGTVPVKESASAKENLQIDISPSTFKEI